jgi:hypothetical protein
MRSTTITEEGRRIRRRLITVAVVIILANLLNLAARALSGRQVVDGPPGSSYASTPLGVLAWKELLDAVDIPTGRLEQPINRGSLNAEATLVILEPGFWDPGEVEVEGLRRFLNDGGRLVLGGWISDDLIESLGALAPSRSFSGPATSSTISSHPETQGVVSVAGPGLGSFADLPGATSLLGESGAVTLLTQPVGEGVIVHLADAEIVSNGYIGRADNAILAVNLAGDRTVIFNEYVHGYGSQGLFAILPQRWRWMLWLLGGALIVWMVAVGRRLGPPEPEFRDLAPERGRYVDSLAALMARSKQPGAATELIRTTARRNLAKRAGLPADASSAQLRAAAEAIGLDTQETDALLTDGPGSDGPRTDSSRIGPFTSENLIAADRALAKITRGDL